MNNSNPRSIFGFPGSLLMLLVLIMPAASSATGTPVSNFIQARVSAIQNGHSIHIKGTTLASAIVLPALYARRDYAPVWSNPVSVRQLIDAIEAIDAEGLDPTDYNLATLRLLLEQNMETGPANPERSADLDLLLTDSLIRLGYHLSFGKVDPEALDSNWNMTRYIEDLDALLALGDSIGNGRVNELLQSLKPQSIKYKRLKSALASYRLYQQLGGWEPVTQGPALKPGMVDARVPQLRARLVATGDLTTQDLYFTTYDDALAAGVMRFQRRHGLADDGVVGPMTLRELNVPVEARIGQIRANLERTRWVMHDLPDTFIMVDIAGFNVRLFRDREVIWETRAVVGQPYRMSPIFRSTLTYLELNPTWTIPPIVLEEDVLPELRKDPGYLEQKDMQVIDYQGDPVDTDSIEWARYTAKNFPWLIRQQPGPKNALGRIKFMFPNPHSVYLHDTPSKSLFNETERAFSSGCIRVEHPLELAVLLLKGNVDWDRGSLVHAVDSLDTHSISLVEPIAIILMYWTVAVEEDGTVLFNRDIYQRDPPIIQGLGKPFRFRDREIIRTHGEMAALR
jgi:murein L,D-transpeptidase YcbB/YkuD